MATLKELHELVHSLDKDEKKHVSIMIDALGGRAKERYAYAYKTVNTLKDFDADKLKSKLGTGVSGMSLTEANSYVYDFICKALISYQQGNKLGYTNQLKLIEILVNKKLLDVAHKHLQKLIPELEENGSLSQWLRAYELQGIIVIQHPKISSDYTFRAKFFEKRFRFISSLQQSTSINYIQYRFYKAVKEIGQARTKAQLKFYQYLWEEPLLKLSADEIDDRALVPYYLMKGAIAAALYKPECYQYALNAIQDYQKRFAGKISSHAESNLFENLLTFMITTPNIDYNEFQWAKKRTLELIENIPQKAVKQQRYAKIIMVELGYFLKTKQYKKGIEHFEKAMKPVEKEKWSGALLSHAIPWLGARLHYLDKNPDKALDCLLLVGEHEKSMRPNVYIDYKFLLLLCHYKLENHSLVSSTADSLYKSLLKQEKLYAPERALLRFVRGAGTIEKMKSNMRQLYTTYLELEKDVFNTPFFQYGDYLAWLKMEIENKRP